MVGPANLQLQARDPNGFDEHLLPRVERLPGVKQAAPLLEQDARLCRTSTRCVAINVAGTDLGLALLDELAHTLPISTLEPGGIALSRTTASQLGIGAQAHNAPVSLDLRGQAISLKIAAVLGPEAVGALSQAFVATMPLANLQKLAGLQGRVTRILVQTEPGHENQVRGELQRVAHGQLTVAPADQDLALLRQALRPERPGQRVLRRDRWAVGLPVRVQRDAADGPGATPDDRRPSPLGHQAHRDRANGPLPGPLPGDRGVAAGTACRLRTLRVFSPVCGLSHSGVHARRRHRDRQTAGAAVTPRRNPGDLPGLGGPPARPTPRTRRGRGVLRRGRARKHAWLAGATKPRLCRRRAAHIGDRDARAAAFACAARLHRARADCRTRDPADIHGCAARGPDGDEHTAIGFTILPVAIMSLKATTLRSLALAATGAVALFGSVASAEHATTCCAASTRTPPTMPAARISGSSIRMTTRQPTTLKQIIALRASLGSLAWPACIPSRAATSTTANAVYG